MVVMVSLMTKGWLDNIEKSGDFVLLCHKCDLSQHLVDVYDSEERVLLNVQDSDDLL